MIPSPFRGRHTRESSSQPSASFVPVASGAPQITIRLETSGFGAARSLNARPVIPVKGRISSEGARARSALCPHCAARDSFEGWSALRARSPPNSRASLCRSCQPRNHRECRREAFPREAQDDPTRAVSRIDQVDRTCGTAPYPPTLSRALAQQQPLSPAGIDLWASR